MKYSYFTYRLISVSLTTLVYFTSVGVVIGKHHCKMQEQNSELTCADTGCKKGCCSTDLQYFQLDQDQQVNNSGLELSAPLSQFIITFVETFLIESSVETKITTHKFYKPPLIFRDIPVLFESFLL